ncbi:MAG: GNAT family N-acetyltransferase/peptidase C39 family protein [Gammaproteobacteria bacterium]|nr:GNAT family N-acetyltransferase/peptidase C39 family protein [Gammaproteobacteria bacterium]
MLRTATIDDLDALVELENRCFELDRLSRRNFRYMLTKANGATLVEDCQGELAGYVLVLFHAGTSLARMYSLAVDRSHRGEGLGGTLIEAAEAAALKRGCVYMRLEVRPDNAGAIALYRKYGYRQFGVLDDYYEDHADALRFEKLMVPHLQPELVRVPYYEQTLDFTCGPAAIMMAMKALDDSVELNRQAEIRIWRESTTVFMTSGHGGCGAHGLALSAYHRGFDVEIYVKDETPMFVDSVRNEEKKEVIRLVQDEFIQEVAALPIAEHYTKLGVEELKAHFSSGGIPIVLISSYLIYKEKSPHWVVVTGFDDRFIYVHDPFVDYEIGKNRMDCINLPILQADFDRMARYGKTAQRAALIVRRRSTTRKRGLVKKKK